MSLPFLLSSGTNGFIAAPFNLLTTELNGLGSGAAATSSVGGTSGVFSQTNSTSAIWGSLYFTAGGSFTPTGGYLAGWFLLSPDGGSNFETVVATPSTTVSAISRAADFTIPLDAAGFASTNIRWCQGRFIQMPWESYKIVLQNMSGATLPSSGNLISVGGTAESY